MRGLLVPATAAYNTGVRRLLVVALFVGCYAPVAPAGAPCGEDGACPTGLGCFATPQGDRCLPAAPGSIDAPPEPPVDSTSIDGPAACTPRTLLAGGSNAAEQGWEIVRIGNGSISTANGITTLATTGDARQLLVLRDAIPADRFIVEVNLEVVASGARTTGLGAVALMMSFHDPSGDAMDLSRMVALDTLGMQIGTASVGFDTTTMHAYQIERTATGSIRAAVGGGGTVTVSPFTTNGTIAIGDQSTAPGLDSTIRISSILLMCP